jgi:hypothetical protein
MELLQRGGPARRAWCCSPQPVTLARLRSEAPTRTSSRPAGVIGPDSEVVVAVAMTSRRANGAGQERASLGGVLTVIRRSLHGGQPPAKLPSHQTTTRFTSRRRHSFRENASSREHEGHHAHCFDTDVCLRARLQRGDVGCTSAGRSARRRGGFVTRDALAAASRRGGSHLRRVSTTGRSHVRPSARCTPGTETSDRGLIVLARNQTPPAKGSRHGIRSSSNPNRVTDASERPSRLGEGTGFAPRSIRRHSRSNNGRPRCASAGRDPPRGDRV